ncbi:unnamed protein product [Dovyalis caffra]|uniref:Uncharacterized protein n=1 Tax=Dovyalis caffra TaxID=77055 RepID=A0AAV1RL78_9ROSI|nr:unnamed protein product [Dovyalis caffra]
MDKGYGDESHKTFRFVPYVPSFRLLATEFLDLVAIDVESVVTNLITWDLDNETQQESNVHMRRKRKVEHSECLPSLFSFGMGGVGKTIGLASVLRCRLLESSFSVVGDEQNLHLVEEMQATCFDNQDEE